MQPEIPNTLPVAILGKLSAIQKGIRRMVKEGRNSAQGYSYLQESQIAEAFKNLFEEHGVLFTYSSTIKEVRPSPTGKQLVTDVSVRYQFVDVDTGEYISGVAAGQGSDATDKGVYKAITGAVKYIFMKTFLIPTGDDPENDRRGAKKSYPPEDGELPFGGEEED